MHEHEADPPAKVDAQLRRTEAEIRAYRDGQSSALESLFERYYAVTHRIVAARLGRDGIRLSVDEEDLVQDALLAAFRSLDCFEHRSEGAFRHWLATVVQNRIRDIVRFDRAERRDVRRAERIATELKDQIEAPQRTPSRILIAHEIEARYRAALDRLSAYHAELIVLRRDCGMSHAEIAERLELSVDACKMAYSRARAKLREILAQMGEGESQRP